MPPVHDKPDWLADESQSRRSVYGKLKRRALELTPEEEFEKRRRQPEMEENQTQSIRAVFGKIKDRALELVQPEFTFEEKGFEGEQEVPVLRNRFNARKAWYHGQHPWHKDYRDGQERYRNITSSAAPRCRHVYGTRDIVPELRELLMLMDQPSGLRFVLHHYLDESDLRALEEENARECEVRQCTRPEASHLRELRVSHFPENAKVIGERLHLALLYASTPVIFNGNTHDIPIIVRGCAEQLIRKGLYDKTLSKEVPELERLVDLIDIYNEGPSFGQYFNPMSETVADMYGLLVHFLKHLPSPIIPDVLFHPLWYWCVKPTVARANEKRRRQEAAEYDRRDSDLAAGIVVPREDFIYRQKPLQWTDEERENNADWEDRQINVAVYLLRMLPVANLSLFTYLMDLFTKLCESRMNDLGIQGVSRHFGNGFVGGNSKADACRVMEWILERWVLISDRMFAENRKAYEEKLNPESQAKLLVTSPSFGTGEAIQ